MNVLLSCAGRRDYLARFFRAAEPGTRVIGMDASPHAPALRSCDVAIIAPPVRNPEYVEALMAACVAHEIHLVVPLNDHELPVLARARARIEASTGARVVVSDSATVDRCFDKRATARWLADAGFDAVPDWPDAEGALGAIAAGAASFPLVVKPRWGSASDGVTIVHDEAELRAACLLAAAREARRTEREVGADAAVEPELRVLVQPRLEGTEFGVDVLNDFAGRTRDVSVKQKLAMRAGETDRSCLRDHPALAALGRRLGEALGHVGNLDCDAFVDERGRATLLELNPRFGGGYPFSELAGARYPAALLAWARGEVHEPGRGARAYDVVHSKTEELVRIDPASR